MEYTSALHRSELNAACFCPLEVSQTPALSQRVPSLTFLALDVLPLPLHHRTHRAGCAKVLSLFAFASPQLLGLFLVRHALWFGVLLVQLVAAAKEEALRVSEGVCGVVA